MNPRELAFDIVPHNGPMVCDFCHEEVEFLIGISQTETDLDGSHCKNCFKRNQPEHSEAITDFEELLLIVAEIKARCMTLDEMYELYGDEESEDEESEDEEQENEEE